MNKLLDAMRSVSPLAVLKQIADAIPENYRRNVVVIGSLAVGYRFFTGKEIIAVRTKDADCLLSPRTAAIMAGESIADRLFEKGWTLPEYGDWAKPGNKHTPLDRLPAVRLYPPGETDWFIELLTVPTSPAEKEKKWARLETSRGDFGLPSFRFLSLANYEPLETPLGIYVARPETLALANLFEHPQIGPELMSGLINGRRIKRSNKDLGRVLAISYLSTLEDVDSLEKWPEVWEKALRSGFPDEFQEIARNAGSGLRNLLHSEVDLNEAYHTCRYGLLASKPPKMEQLRIAGERLLQDAVSPIEKLMVES